MEDGYVSPSIVGVDIGCGMRVHLTNLHRDDLPKQARKELINRIETYVPSREPSHSGYSDIWLEDVVMHGVHGLPKSYIPDHYTARSKRSLTHLEAARYSFKHEYLEQIPERSWKLAHGQLGTLGSGNHFLEIQCVQVDEGNRHIAQKWGLFDGQVVVMIHSGSRAWGGALGAHYMKSVREYMQAHRIGNPEPSLVYCPIQSKVGEMYIHLMYSALNYAIVNRHLMAYGAYQAFRDLFGKDVEMKLLYDLMHNYALQETHDGEDVLVHRKGATRALPKHHELLPKAYKDTGHPALIPGSMGTASYIMVGEAEGQKNRYSICHGAGRVFSRSTAKERVDIDAFKSAMRVGQDDEIVTNHNSLENIRDEAPQAYKDVDAIIDSVAGAGLASVVAVCKPLAVVKGV